jgi:predicted nucleic acid-binding protein
MIVVDVNVIAYRFIQGEKSALACRVQEQDPEWIVPGLWRHEFLNVLATTTRTAIFTAAEAFAVWQSAQQTLANSQRPVNYQRALACAVDYKISAYDAQYITLARSLNCLCISEDARLCKVFPGIAISMQTFITAGA